jgi:hypothetical protein
MTSRNDFSKQTLDTLSKRVGFRCSNPACRQPTAGPGKTVTTSINIGVGAHIHAASPGGPRFALSQTTEQRSGIGNGIWLCQNCAKLVDSDVQRYTAAILNDWKSRAEQLSREALEGEMRAEPIVTINVRRRNIKITGDRHDYRLEVTVHNVSATILRGYHVDLLFPTAVLTTEAGRVEGRSDSISTLFRKTWATAADDIYPNDVLVLFHVEYHMTDSLFRREPPLFDLPVTVAAFLDGKRLSILERRFEEFQVF